MAYFIQGTEVINENQEFIGRGLTVGELTYPHLSGTPGEVLTLAADGKTIVFGKISGGGGGAPLVVNLSYNSDPDKGTIYNDSGTSAVIPLANGAIAGLSKENFSTALKDKLEAINVGGGGINEVNLGYLPSDIDGTISNDTGSDAIIPLADAANAGLSRENFTTALKDKLENLEYRQCYVGTTEPPAPLHEGDLWWNPDTDQFKVYVQGATDGVVDTLGVVRGGSGYSNATGLSTSGGNGFGLTVDIEVDAYTQISRAIVNDGGHGYASGDEVYVDGGNGILRVTGVTSVATGSFDLVNSGGGGGGLQSRTTASSSTLFIANDASDDLDITSFAKTAVLFSVETSDAAWVTFYTTAAARTADAGRVETADPAPGSGVLAEVITTGAQTVSLTPATTVFNGDTSPVDTIYAKVVNKSGANASIIVTLSYLQLED